MNKSGKNKLKVKKNGGDWLKVAKIRTTRLLVAQNCWKSVKRGKLTQMCHNLQKTC